MGGEMENSGASPEPLSAQVTQINSDQREELAQNRRDLSRADSPARLRRDISLRQMVFMALGGSIGAGLFVASGQALSAGGPGSVVACFALTGAMVTVTMSALGEMAAAYPIEGAFYDYSVRFISPSWGFAMGWNFVFNWLIVLPFELTTIAAQLKFWAPNVRAEWIVGPFLVGLVFVGLSGSKGFGEVEHWLGLLKVSALTVFMIVAVLIIAGGMPTDPRHGVGNSYWINPGAFRNGITGFMLVFRIAGMSYGGTEMLGLTAAECRNPAKMMPVATKVVFFRIIIFYLGSLFFLGFVVPSDSPDLASTGHGAKYSPFVLAAQLAGQPPLAHFFNAAIVCALVSMSNASIFASSRALQALCMKGMGPRILSGTTRWMGLPLAAMGVSLGLGTLAFVNAAPGGEVIFDWLLSLSSVSNYFTWMSICIAHLRFRRALKVQHRHPAELLSWRSVFGEWGSWFGIAICVLSLFIQIMVAAFPLGGKHVATTVVRDVIGIPFVMLLYGTWKTYSYLAGTEPLRFLTPLEEVDLDTGLNDGSVPAAEPAAQSEMGQAAAPLPEVVSNDSAAQNAGWRRWFPKRVDSDDGRAR